MLKLGNRFMKFIDLESQQQRIRPALDRRIATVLAHGQYILGPEVMELEQVLAAYVGVHHCITMASGTDALLAALMALDVGPGDEVITTGFSFIATAEVIALLGAKPVYVDIDPHTFNLDPDQLTAAVNHRTKALLPVSLYGQCADFTHINALADEWALPVIEDGAQSFGATQHGRRSCGLSTVGCTSFFPSKPLGCYGDGGAIFTDDAQLADTLRTIRNHGQSQRYYHTRLGINGRLDTLQAAILLEKIAIFPDEVERRNLIAQRYIEHLIQVPDITLPVIQPDNTSVFGQFTLRVKNREFVLQSLQRAGIPTAVHYPQPMYRQPALLDESICLPECERAAQEVLSLPFHPYMDEADIVRVVDALILAVAGN